MQKETERYYTKKAEKLQNTHQQLIKYHPKNKMDMYNEQLFKQQKQMNRAMNTIIQSKGQVFASMTSKLTVLNPLNIMERGYSIAFDKNNSVIKSKQQVQSGDEISVIVKDGQIICEVKESKESVINE